MQRELIVINRPFVNQKILENADNWQSHKIKWWGKCAVKIKQSAQKCILHRTLKLPLCI